MFPKFVLLLHGFVSECAWICIVFGNWIWIQVKIQELSRLTNHNGAVDAQNGGFVGQWWQIRITLTRSMIRIRIEVKSWIRIRIKVMWIRAIRTPVLYSSVAFGTLYR